MATDTSIIAYEIGTTNKEGLKQNECQALCCTASSIHKYSISFYPAWLLTIGLVDLNAAGKPEKFSKLQHQLASISAQSHSDQV